MHHIVKTFEEKGRFKDESEAEIIRQKLETLVFSIQVEVAKRDERFHGILIKSGSVYEGVKVHQPDEFDFMVRIDCLTNKPRLSCCEDVPGYVRLAQDDEKWGEFTDEQGFFSPNQVCSHYKRLVNESWSTIDVPEGMAVQEVEQGYIQGPWGVVYTGLVGGEGRPSDVMDIESHGPATTIKVLWNGGSSYRGLLISVDLTLSLEYAISKLPVRLSDQLPPTIASEYLNKAGFHVVPAGFDMWRISFSIAEKEILSDCSDDFKACYRVLKYVRDSAADNLDLETSLVPSYVFKSVLLSRYFAAGAESKEQEYWLEQVEDTLDIVLRLIKHGDIQNFFLSGYNLLSTTDHKNKLRQIIVENMLSLVKSLKMTHTREEVRETKRQIRVLESVDIIDFLLSEGLAGRDITAFFNKLFVNIDDVPTGGGDREGVKFLEQITDLDELDLDEDVYVNLIQNWAALEYLFDQLILFLPEEVKILARKFYIRTWHKREKFEREHKACRAYPIKQITVRDAACEYIMSHFTDYIDEKGSSAGNCYSNLLKAIPPDFTSRGFIGNDIADITLKEGSERGRAMFVERIMKFMSLYVPESVLMSVIVGFVSQIFVHGKEMLRRKLDYIEIPELDLD